MEALDGRVLHGPARAQLTEPGAGLLVEMSTCLGHRAGDSSNAHQFVCVAARKVLTRVRNGPLGDT